MFYYKGLHIVIKRLLGIMVSLLNREDGLAESTEMSVRIRKLNYEISP